MRKWVTPHKEMTLTSTQNLKTLGLWIFFLICCSTISFLLNVGLDLYTLIHGLWIFFLICCSTISSLLNVGLDLYTLIRDTLESSVRKRGNTGEISNNEKMSLNPHKWMIPPSTQNLKTMGLWVLFLICCLTISFILNMGLRLTLGYLTVCKL